MKTRSNSILYCFLCMLLLIWEVSSSGIYGQVNTGTVKDIDGNVYKTIKIGDQVWMVENLKVTHFRNGDPIPNVTVNLEWGKLTSGAYCSHGNNEDNASVYGSLYNWYAVNDERKIAPEGWYVATDKDWKKLEIALGMSLSHAYDKRERGTNEGSKLAGNGELWNDKDVLESDAEFGTSGFSALPGGSRRDNFGIFTYLGISAFFWTSTESDEDEAWCRRVADKHSDVFRNDVKKANGFSIRCVKDSEGASKLNKKGDSVYGAYLHEENPEDYMALEADGKITISQGTNKITGRYSAKDKVITLTLENGRSGELKIENGDIKDPSGVRWIKE